MSESNKSNDLLKNKSIMNKNVSYSTDYHVNLLEVSDKLKQPDERILYTKPEERNIDNNHGKNDSDKTNYESDSTSSRDLNSYIDNKQTKNSSETEKKYTDSAYFDNTPNSIFAKPFTEIKNDNGKLNSYGFDNNQNNQNNQNNENNVNNGPNEQREDYDNYNELSSENQMLKKLDMLRKLGELAQYGVKLSQNYNMNSDYFTMKYEYELHKNIRAKQNFINWTSSIMLNCIYGVEILNDKYNPFDLKLSGWSEQINADISSYYDIFGEIYEKYNKPGKSMSPELRLILMLGGGALKFHLNNIALSNKPSVSNNQMSYNSGSQDSKIVEQMRQQALIDRMREESNKQNDLLKKKVENEHIIANQQMKDMLFLQQKQDELLKQEELKKQKMADFERIRLMMESNKSNNQQNNQQNNIYDEARRNQISMQLQQMKNSIKNIDIPTEIESQPLYDKVDANVVKRSNQTSKKSNINVDTSSEKSSDKSSNKSESNSTSSSESSNLKSLLSKTKELDKSLNSKNNQSTFSKRKYKKNALTVDTA